jgi:hypothetical protein
VPLSRRLRPLGARLVYRSDQVLSWHPAAQPIFLFVFGLVVGFTPSALAGDHRLLPRRGGEPRAAAPAHRAGGAVRGVLKAGDGRRLMSDGRGLLAPGCPTTISVYCWCLF